MAGDVEAEELLRFWFADAAEDPEAARERQQLWFGASAEFDRQLQTRFGRLWVRACEGELSHWAGTPRGRLALILLLDQLSRNLGRGTAQAYAQDREALHLALAGLAQGDDAALSPIERSFFLMPLQHAEDPAVQDRSVAEFRRLYEQAPGPWKEMLGLALGYAEEHRDIVHRFGRFPHRNRVLGRDSGAEERAFLESGASSYGQ